MRLTGAAPRSSAAIDDRRRWVRFADFGDRDAASVTNSGRNYWDYFQRALASSDTSITRVALRRYAIQSPLGQGPVRV
jgi:hypothetical protein